MKKKTSKLLVLLVSVFAIYGFTKLKKTDSKQAKYNVPSADYFASVPQEIESIHYFDLPNTGNSFVGFKEALAFKESRGNYNSVNTFGYLGKYQFGKGTLKRFKIYDTAEFLKNPELQEDAFLALCSVNKWILQRDIKRFVGKRINGTEITESGILAAAHLAGAGNVKTYLRSYGQVTFKDAYGSSIKHYIKKFAGYDTSFIEANRLPVL